MRHPPEVMLYVAPVALICGVSLVIGLESGSTIAWCVATAAGVVCIGLPAALHYHVSSTERLLEDSLQSAAASGQEREPYLGAPFVPSVPPEERLAHTGEPATLVAGSEERGATYDRGAKLAGKEGILTIARLMSQPHTRDNAEKYLDYRLDDAPDT